MKDFKSQGIDTPGVIDRVSTLFRGHPSLIQGFNTFLPPGYRIECSVSNATGDGSAGPGGAAGGTTITVTTPMGMTTRTQLSGSAPGPGELQGAEAQQGDESKPNVDTAGQGPTAATQVKQEQAGTGAPVASAPAGTSSMHLSNMPAPPAGLANMQAQAGVGPAAAGSTPMATTPGAATVLSNSMGTNAPAAEAGSSANGTAAPHQDAPGAASVGSAAQAASAPNSAGSTSTPGVPPQSQQQQGTPAPPGQARPPMEFNHAINYVNKIKNRFVREPETYKAFLEILQTYQKEGRAIQDVRRSLSSRTFHMITSRLLRCTLPQVYAQVTTLFHSAPDLLDEFKQFLPDTSAEGQAAAAAAQAAPLAGAGRGGAAPGAAAAAGPGKRAAPAAAAPAAAPPAAKRAKGAAGKESGATGAGAGPGKGKGKRKANDATAGRATKGASPADPHALYHSDSPSVAGDPHQQAAAAAAAYYYGGAPPLPQQQQHAASQQYGLPAGVGVGGPPPVYAYEPPAPAPAPEPLLPPKPVPSQPDLAFFNRVKAHCKDQETYHEFLKLVNLYTQQLIDLTALIARAWLFLHQDDALWSEFKELVGWVHAEPYVEGVLGDPGHRVELDAFGRRVIENVPREDGPRWRKSHGDAGKWWETYGPSYRRLPPSEISLNCSGRDALCWEVLNDEWGELGSSSLKLTVKSGAESRRSLDSLAALVAVR